MREESEDIPIAFVNYGFFIVLPNRSTAFCAYELPILNAFPHRPTAVPAPLAIG